MKKAMMWVVVLAALVAVWSVRWWLNAEFTLSDIADWDGYSVCLVMFVVAVMGGCIYAVVFCLSLAELDLGRLWSIAKVVGGITFVFYCVTPYPTSGFIGSYRIYGSNLGLILRYN